MELVWDVLLTLFGFLFFDKKNKKIKAPSTYLPGTIGATSKTALRDERVEFDEDVIRKYYSLIDTEEYKRREKLL